MRVSHIIAAAALLFAATISARAAADDPGTKFEKFCSEWMQKLAVRERDNIKNIHWVPDGNGVEGEYVGYSSEHTCKLNENGGGKAPVVGKIIYREYRYMKKGSSPDAAQTSTPQAVEATEVTEIFRYAKGKWEY